MENNQLTREKLLNEMEDVIKSTKAERNRVLENRARITRGELEISKTIISANKNIVSAALTAKGLLNDEIKEN